MIKVLYADDHAMVREGIKLLLEEKNDIRISWEASNGTECLDILKRKIPDVLLLDMNMPEMNGIDVLSMIREKEIPVKVLIVTVHREVEYLLRAAELDVDGYILKDSTSGELIKAIQNVHAGKKYIQPSLIPAMNARLIHMDSDKDKIKSLTKRENQILILIANGNCNKEIASELNISERTVKNHISNIFKKIDVADRTQAAVFSIKNNLISIF